MPAAPFAPPLTIATDCDYQVVLTCYASDLAQVDISACQAAVLELYVTPQDPSPLISVSLESGNLVMGVAPPVPEGLFVIEQGDLAQLGTAAYAQPGIVATIVDTVASIAALEALPTSGYQLSNVVLVTGGAGQYFQFSPGDTRTPNGTTIVAAYEASGNWLLCGTVTISIPASMAGALTGFDTAKYNLFVSWDNYATSLFMSGTAYVGTTYPSQ
jgi:hypothetical protein